MFRLYGRYVAILKIIGGVRAKDAGWERFGIDTIMHDTLPPRNFTRTMFFRSPIRHRICTRADNTSPNLERSRIYMLKGHCSKKQRPKCSSKFGDFFPAGEPRRAFFSNGSVRLGRDHTDIPSVEQNQLPCRQRHQVSPLKIDWQYSNVPLFNRLIDGWKRKVGSKRTPSQP